jgi:outer membrane protein
LYADACKGLTEEEIAPIVTILAGSHMTEFNLRTAVLAAALAASAAPGWAADLPTHKSPPAPAPEASLDTYDPFQIRLRAVGVLPTLGNNSVYSNGALVGKGLTVQNQVIPEIDLSYYFTRNIAVEAICCFSYANVKAVNGLSSLGTVGSTWMFPPTVTLQYHFTNFGAFQPYVGLGVNYTHYFNEQPSGGLAGEASFRIQDSWGVAVQAGADYMLTRNWGLNADVKYITMSPTAKFEGALPLNSKVDINPVLVGVGITYRFGGSDSHSVTAKY